MSGELKVTDTEEIYRACLGMELGQKIIFVLPEEQKDPNWIREMAERIRTDRKKNREENQENNQEESTKFYLYAIEDGPLKVEAHCL